MRASIRTKVDILMLDLRAISSVAPIGDLKFGLYAILAAVAFANLLTIPRVWQSDQHYARLLLALIGLGVVATGTTLVLVPPLVYLAILGYVVAFAITGLLISLRTGSWVILLCTAIGSALMCIALVAAYWIASAPR